MADEKEGFMRLKDRVALITGAAGDIGRATAVRFAEEGALVVISDISREGCKKSLDEISKVGSKCSMIIADITKEAEIVSMVAKVKEDYGRLDILVNIAGGDYEPMVGIDELTYEKMSLNLDVNLKSCILASREASNIMMDQEYGKIINMCSVLWRGSTIPMQHSYSASKGGVYAFTRSMAMTLGPYNVNVNGIAPSLIEVEAIKVGAGDEMWQALKEDVEARYPLGRIGQPVDVANCALFLASEESSFITGQIIDVAGGARM
jgi:3-oxoacyl-[acyl-carrier protein] reductase